MKPNELIIDYVDKLKSQRKFFVDLGAGDGIKNSNTYDLYKIGWNGFNIDINEKLFNRLLKNQPNSTNKKIRITKENIVYLFKQYKVPYLFGVLNIDIDGNDYYVLEEILMNYEPLIICAEYNPYFPPPIKFTIQYDPEFWYSGHEYWGASLQKLYELGKFYEYDLININSTCAFFIKKCSNIFKSYTAQELYEKNVKNNINLDKELDLIVYNYIKNYVLKQSLEDIVTHFKKEWHGIYRTYYELGY